MKFTVESDLINDSTGLLCEFAALMSEILRAKDEEHLRIIFSGTILKYFNYGFGASHFWVCQKQDPEKKRIIFIEF